VQLTRAHRLVGALLAASLLVAACGDDDDGEGGDASTTTAAAAFPVTVTADNGEIEIPAEPERIVSLSPSLTEMLFAMDAGDQVVAVDKSSNYPQGTPMTDMSGFSPNVEAIGGYSPDLVVLSRDKDGAAAALSQLGIPTLVLSSADDLDQVYDEISTLGDATGHPDEAADLVDDMRSDIDAAVADLPQRDEPLTYFYEVSDDYFSATSDSFIGSVLGLAGLRSIADGVDDAAGGFPQLTAEYVLDQDPDYVFISHAGATSTDLAAITSRPGWAELQAVQEGHVVLLDDDLASRWGPRVVDLLEAVIAALTADSTTTTTS
jgi:iron complex transport system substrate-binding protein